MNSFLRFIHNIIDERDIIYDLFRCVVFAAAVIFVIAMLNICVISTISYASDVDTKNSRYFLNKTAWSAPFSNYFEKKMLSTVAYEYENKTLDGMLAAKSGDSVEIIRGQFYKNDIFIPELSFIAENPVAAYYSPRDNVEKFKIPAKGDLLNNENDDVATVCFMYNLIKQTQKASISVTIVRNGVEMPDFFVENFALYSGMFEDIPEELKSSKYFWRAFLGWYNENVDNNATLNAKIRNADGDIVYNWVVDENFYFISKNHQESFDSRYTGAIAEQKILGKIGAKIPL